jgi:hypothetical protein
VTYYRIGLFDILAVVLTKGLWLAWIVWRDDKIEIPKEPK